MYFGVILFDIIMLLILTFGLGMLVGRKNCNNEKNCEDNHWEEYEFFEDEE